MRFFFLYFAYALVALSLQTTWLSSFPSRYLHIDLFIFVVAALLFQAEKKASLPTLLVLALFADSISLLPFGVSLISFIILYVMMRLIMNTVSFSDRFAKFFWISVISFSDKVIIGTILYISTGEKAVFFSWLSHAFLQAPCDGLLGLLMLPFLLWYGKLRWENLKKPSKLLSP